MRSITVLDFETSGLTAPEAKVCEVGVCALTLDALDGWRVDGVRRSWLCGVPSIPPEVRAVHHITMEDLAGLDPFGGNDVADICDGADVIAAHSMQFEASFLGPIPLPLLCTYKCALRIWPEAPSHSNSVLRYWLEDQGLLKLDHEKAMPPHRAGPDAYVTAHILLALLKHATVEEMVEWTKLPRLLPRIPMGKHKGKKWAEIDYSYLKWVAGQADMDSDIVWNAQREIDRRVQEDLDMPF